jgi:YfiH family protein
MDNQTVARAGANAPEGSCAAGPDAGCLYIPFAFPGVPSVGCAFSTACAGSVSMTVCPEDTRQAPANRRRLLDALGLSRWAELKQVHGDGFVVDARETPPDQAAELEADGHCTREKGLALLIKTADCQPVLFAAEDGSAVAALHAGWRGNAVNYPASGLKAFCAAYGLEPSRVLAVRGPSLGPAAAEFVNFAEEWLPHFADWFDARQRTMDLWRLTKDQLVSAGMRADRIFGLDLCTRSLPELFFSHRLRHAGRQASLIWIKNGVSAEN